MSVVYRIFMRES